MTYFDFRQIGLEPRDKLVYEILYKHNKASVRFIADVSGLSRGTVHDIVKKLTDAGLATFIQNGPRRHYQASAPDSLASLVRQRREDLLALEETANQYAADLESRNDIPGAEGFATYYHGLEGFSSILRDVLRTTRQLTPREYYAISAHRINSLMYNDFVGYSQQRVKEGIFVRVVADGPQHSRHILTERRILRSVKFNSYTIIYGNKTALLSLDSAGVPTAIVVTDERIAQTQRVLFEQLWDFAQ